MSTYIVRPTSVVRNGGGTNPATQATVLTNLGDNSDATFVTNTGTSAISWVFGLANPAVPSSQFVARCGISLRWKGNAAGNYVIGGTVFRSTDPEPNNFSSIYPTNSAAFTSTELGYIPVDWSNTDVAALQFKWYDGRGTTAWNATEHADIWSTVYAITKSTATPQNKTETQSAVPVISVDLTNTLGWESSVPTSANIRKVRVQTRIESGGTTAGTGTLVATGTSTLTVTATGTTTIQQIASDFLPNGTFRVYSRAMRFRDDPIVREEQFSAWSAAATLTMNVPKPNTPTMTLSTDQVLDRVGITVTPIATASYSGPFIFIERSDDNQATWSPVRGGSGVEGTFGVAQTFYDYEAPRGTTVFYRARVEATLSATIINASSYSTVQSALLTVDGWNFKDPDEPQLNIVDVPVTGTPTEAITEEQGVFRPLGRRYPVIVSGAISGWDGTLTVTTTTEAEWQNVKYLAESQQMLYLESAFGWSKYIRLVSGTSSTLSGTTSSPKRVIALKYVEVERPPVIPGETEPSGNVPAVIDGGDANPTFEDFYDGGNATATWVVSIDGGAAA